MFTLELTEEDLKVLDTALVQLPYYQVAELINKINYQIETKNGSEGKGEK